MDWTSIERSWKHYKTYAQERWNRLSAQQVDATMGKRDELARCVQLAYGLTREETERHISMWVAKQASNPPSAVNT
ncbi:MAG TPA: general stress protein CsbD [Burkholderiales bacterium]|nr:general stress protein CsbD [Burkholderiales bacterium]